MAGKLKCTNEVLRQVFSGTRKFGLNKNGENYSSFLIYKLSIQAEFLNNTDAFGTL